VAYDPDARKGAAIFNRTVEYRMCTRCIMDTSDAEITFDRDGVCNHCHAYDQAVSQLVFPGEVGKSMLEPIVARIKKGGKGKRYDCVIGLSGGVDSTYVAYVTKQLGLRPLAVHLDNGWNSETAVANIEKIITKLGYDLDTTVLDWEEFRRLQLAFLRASTPDSEIPTDHAIVATLFWTAIREGVKWVVEGSNVVTEAMVPATWSHGHSDWRYIEYLNDNFGGAPLKTYPHYTYFDNRVGFPLIHRARRFPILNYLDYDKRAAAATMEKELGWKDYGGKHYESIYTRFYQGYILPRKFGFDKRRPHLSCLVNAGTITREEALAEVAKPAIPPDLEVEDRAFVIKKLGITEDELEAILRAPRKTFWDYPSYERDVRTSWAWQRYDDLISRYPARAKRLAGRIGNKLAKRGLYPDDALDGTVRVQEEPPRNGVVGAERAPKTVCIISLTPVTDEPRVSRQAAAFADRGWDVVVVGLPGKSEKPEEWTRLIEVEHRQKFRRKVVRRLFGQMLTAMKKASKYVPYMAERYYWRYAGYDSIYRAIADVECDLVYANDYFTAPLARRLAEANGVPFAVDVHEYATGQHMHDPRWRSEQRPWIDGLQKAVYRDASLFTVVCDGIARLITDDYRLHEKRPVTVRSLPRYQALPFRPTGEIIEVLYHGILAPARGLEEAIESVKLWRPEFVLLIRGPGPDDYRAKLQALAREHGVAERVALLAPVLFGEMIEKANASDVGFFVQRDISPQKRFTLPNKFFEYIMAGLALCVADLPEMARVVRRYDVGRLVKRAEPRCIADVINGFSRDQIDAYKRRSLEAARELCWENESKVMMAAFARLDPSLGDSPAAERAQPSAVEAAG
jgi:N-acetyl sugar amidotransferase